MTPMASTREQETAAHSGTGFPREETKGEDEQDTAPTVVREKGLGEPEPQPAGQQFHGPAEGPQLQAVRCIHQPHRPQPQGQGQQDVLIAPVGKPLVKDQVIDRLGEQKEEAQPQEIPSPAPGVTETLRQQEAVDRKGDAADTAHGKVPLSAGERGGDVVRGHGGQGDDLEPEAVDPSACVQGVCRAACFMDREMRFSLHLRR